jgi:hypothetical protein
MSRAQLRTDAQRVSELTLNANVDVVRLATLYWLSGIVIGLREGVEGLEILDVCGHETDGRALLLM